MRGLSITAVVRINPETSIRRQRPSEIAASGERERERGGMINRRREEGCERAMDGAAERGSISREMGREHFLQ